MHHWNAVGDASVRGISFCPCYLEDEEGNSYGNSWALGFLHGMDLRRESWKEILDDEDKAEWLISIFALATKTIPTLKCARTKGR